MNDHVDVKVTNLWQSRAKECRDAANRLSTADARRRLLVAAEYFERMASANRNKEPERWPRP
jgi:hypothetical protein